MSESIVEQIQASFKTELEAIAGDGGTNYWYTPGVVVRVDSFNSRQHFKDGYGDYLYLVNDSGDDRPTIQPAGFGETARVLDVFVMVAAKDLRGDRDPFTATLKAGTIRNRMIKDVSKMLDGNYNRGSLAFDTEHSDTRRDFAEPDGWIVGELYFQVTYKHNIGEP